MDGLAKAKASRSSPVWLGVSIFLAYLLAIAWIHVDGHRAAQRGETPLLTDFTSLYAAALVLQQKTAVDLYRPREIYQASLQAAQAAYGGSLSEGQARAVGFHPWMYPPSFAVLAAPLAQFPYLAAWLLWCIATAVPYLVAMRRILSDPSFWIVALASPPVFFNLMYGQSGFLTAGLIALGLGLLATRPVLAGVCIGLASVKPHFGVLIPIALICGAHWRAFASATATVVAMIAVTAITYGGDAWLAFLGTLLASLRGFGHGLFNWSVMPSVLGAMHQLGMDMAWAWRIQACAAIAASIVVGRIWWAGPTQAGRPELAYAILCLATLLAVPMVYLYDLMLLVPAVAWIWADMRRFGHRRHELAILVCLTTALITLREIQPFGPVLGLALTLTLLTLALFRLRRPHASA